MKRREFIALVGASAMWPRATRAQDRIRRVGILMNFAADNAIAKTRVSKFVDALEALGWSEGRNIHIETRWTEGNPEHIRKDIAELLALSPDLIVASTAPAVTPLKRATKSIPILFVSLVDPVGAGLVASLSKPGGNATGFVAFEYALAAKWLELLGEVAPRVTRAAVLRDSTVATGIGLFAAIQTVGRMGMELSAIDLGDLAEMERDITAFAREPNGGMIVTPSGFIGNHPAAIAETAARNRLPAVYPFRYFVTAGGLISYGPNQYDDYLAAAGYADRILKGERPADLPVQVPTKYELVVNLKAAKALGLAPPQSLLARADEVIE